MILEVFAFIFKCLGQFFAMLFTVDIGLAGITLGHLFSYVYIYLPLAISILLIFKGALLKVDLEEPITNDIRSRRESRIENSKYKTKTYRGKHEYMGKHSKNGLAQINLKNEKLKEMGSSNK